jgi:hypothetical protein
MPILELDAREVIPELKPKTEILLFLSLVFGFFFFFCVLFFVAFLFCFLSYHCGFLIFLFLFLFSFFFLYYQLHHHCLLILILTPFTCPPSPVLQCIVLLPNYLFYAFSSTLPPCLHLPFPPSPNLAPHYPSSYTLTTCWLTYCTNCTQPNPCNPWHSTLHFNNRDTPKHTQGPQNPAAPHSFPH